jgi:hypothetical protein
MSVCPNSGRATTGGSCAGSAPLAPSLWDKWVSGGGNCRLLSQAMSEHGVSEGEANKFCTRETKLVPIFSDCSHYPIGQRLNRGVQFI